MPSIDPNLFQRLKDKLDVGAAALYGKIQSAANKYGLERPEAALALALDQKLNINNYSSAAQRATVATARSGRVSHSSPPSISEPVRSSRTQAAGKRPAGRTKGNDRRNHPYVRLSTELRITSLYARAIQTVADKNSKSCGRHHQSSTSRENPQ